MRIKIHEHTNRKRAHETNVKAHRNDFTELKELCSQYVELEDVVTFYSTPLNYFLEQLEIKHSNRYKNISSDKLCFLFDIPLERIKQLSNRILSSDIKINPIDLTEINPIDFAEYAEEPEEIDRYNLAKEWCEIFEKTALFTTVYPALVSQGTGGILMPDFERKGYLKPNYKWVLNKKQRNY